MSNRIPKYKAWHKAEKKMCEVETINSRGAFLLGVEAGEDQIVDRMVIEAPTDGRFCDMDEIELLKCTWLLDKNNKEVFEGDVLKLESGHLRKVVFRKFGFWLDAINETANFPICFFKENDLNTFEVVGDIYQNKNLL